jgi:hypothetical protein
MATAITRQKPPPVQCDLWHAPKSARQFLGVGGAFLTIPPGIPPGHTDDVVAGVNGDSGHKLGIARKIVLVCLPPSSGVLMLGVRQSSGASHWGELPVKIVVYWTD